MAREVLRVGTPRSRTKRRPADRLDKAFHCAGPSRGCGLARHPFAHPVRRAALCLWSRRSRRGRIGMRRREGGNVRRTARESVRAVTASEHGRRSHAGLERFSDAFFKGARAPRALARRVSQMQSVARGEWILSTEPCSPAALSIQSTAIHPARSSLLPRMLIPTQLTAHRQRHKHLHHPISSEPHMLEIDTSFGVLSQSGVV